MWEGFEGVARTRDQTLDRINALNWTSWHPQGVTLHNTAAPRLAQWAESGPSHDARIRNLQSYYENQLGWHAGPHWFVSRNWINWFSNPLLPGVHSRCYNATRFGIEMVGDYNAEEFDTGDGALVRDNAVFLIAALNLKFGFSPEDLTFHKQCVIDNHDCPGRNVVKTDIIARVRAAMATVKSVPPVVSDVVPSPRMLGITATVFGGDGDEQRVAYQDVTPGWPNRSGVALPARFSDPRHRRSEQAHRPAGGPARQHDILHRSNNAARRLPGPAAAISDVPAIRQTDSCGFASALTADGRFGQEHCRTAQAVHGCLQRRPERKHGAGKARSRQRGAGRCDRQPAQWQEIRDRHHRRAAVVRIADLAADDNEQRINPGAH